MVELTFVFLGCQLCGSKSLARMSDGHGHNAGGFHTRLYFWFSSPFFQASLNAFAQEKGAQGTPFISRAK